MLFIVLFFFLFPRQIKRQFNESASDLLRLALNVPLSQVLVDVGRNYWRKQTQFATAQGNKKKAALAAFKTCLRLVSHIVFAYK